MRSDSFGGCRRAAPRFLLLTLVFLSAAVAASGQEAGTEQHVRVPKSHANVHGGSSSGRPVLVLVRKDTVLPVVGRHGEWLEVELSPELKETGMVIRWYNDEERGWMHESTVVLVENEQEDR